MFGLQWIDCYSKLVNKGQLVKMGIAATRLAAEGYGEQHPVADNTTAEGRAQNRRIDIRVTKK